MIKTQPAKIIHLFNHTKQRIIVQISENKAEEEICNFVKNYLQPNVQNSCHFSSETLYKIFCNVVRDNFDATMQLSVAT